jgi:hypothetical protein
LRGPCKVLLSRQHSLTLSVRRIANQRRAQGQGKTGSPGREITPAGAWPAETTGSIGRRRAPRASLWLD